MADAAAPAKGLADFGKKVGPFPLGVWLAGRRGPGLVLPAAASQGRRRHPGGDHSRQTGYGTDPAGNTGYIDPSTGYVYGSAEDISALAVSGPGRRELL